MTPASAASAEFYRLPEQARADAETAAATGHQVDDFFDLSPQERAEVYERAVQDYWGPPATKETR